MDREFANQLRSKLEEEKLKGALDKIINPKLPKGFHFPNMDPNLARKGAVLILFYEKKDGWYFPLIQRPTYDGVHSGQVAFPGGRMEESDTDLVATALRESWEEVGVLGEKIDVSGYLSDFFVAASNHIVRPVIGFYEDVPSYIPDAREVEKVIEAPLIELLKQPILMKEVVSAKGYTLTSPTFIFDDRVVWGATAMMLTELKRILKEIPWAAQMMQ